jgi:Ni,Fe-hydrogenase maturation factor
MQTITIDILNHKALKLLEDLELLQLIRLRKEKTLPAKDTLKRLKPSDFRGSISKETADKLNAHVEQSRNELNKN